MGPESTGRKVLVVWVEWVVEMGGEGKAAPVEPGEEGKVALVEEGMVVREEEVVVGRGDVRERVGHPAPAAIYPVDIPYQVWHAQASPVVKARSMPVMLMPGKVLLFSN